MSEKTVPQIMRENGLPVSTEDVHSQLDSLRDLWQTMPGRKPEDELDVTALAVRQDRVDTERFHELMEQNGVGGAQNRGEQ